MSAYVGLTLTIIMGLTFTVSAFLMSKPTLGWMAAVSWAISGVASFGLAYSHAEYANFWQNWSSYLALVVFLGFATVMSWAANGWSHKNETDEEPNPDDEKVDESDGDMSDSVAEERTARRRGLLYKVRDMRHQRTRDLKNQAILRKTNARIARGG